MICSPLSIRILIKQIPFQPPRGTFPPPLGLTPLLIPAVGSVGTQKRMSCTVCGFFMWLHAYRTTGLRGRPPRRLCLPLSGWQVYDRCGRVTGPGARPGPPSPFSPWRQKAKRRGPVDGSGPRRVSLFQVELLSSVDSSSGLIFSSSSPGVQMGTGERR